MKGSNRGFIIGLLFLFLGILIAANAFGFTVRISWLFFRGWWTLFLIIPGIIGLFREDTRRGSAKKLIVGIVLFLLFNRLLSIRMTLLIIGAALLAYWGVRLIAGASRGRREGSDRYYGKTYGRRDSTPGAGAGGRRDKIVYSAVFSDKTIRVENERFDGAELSATFGDIKLDLRNSFVIDDVVIRAKAVFGDIRIRVPRDVKVMIEGTPVFGEISRNRQNPEWADENTPVIRVEASCVFGDISVK